jgi:hypothetical protein
LAHRASLAGWEQGEETICRDALGGQLPGLI